MSDAHRASAYAPRNALNAEVLKADIAARSQARGDDVAVRAWLLNHFYRHLVANFEPARRIHSLDEARQAWGGETLPAWVNKRFTMAETASGADIALAPVVWIDLAEPSLLALEVRLVEFLQSRTGTALEGKLDRVNCPQALALWDKEHAEMALRIERGWRQSWPEALRPVLETANGRFVEFLAESAQLRSEMAFESYVMRHCLGQFADRKALCGGYGEHYAQAIETRQLRLLSFRDEQGQPHITISVHVNNEGQLTVDQVKGKQNRPPIERYVQDVLACLDHLHTDMHIPPDCIAIGIVRTSLGWQRIEEVTASDDQIRLVSQHPQLFLRLVVPTPMVEWLVAARQPDLLQARIPRAISVRYATRSVWSNTILDDSEAAAYVTEGVFWPGMQTLRNAKTS